MSLLYVVLGFVLICLILVHVNLHQRKNELYKFIENVNKTLMTRHKKISKLLSLLEPIHVVEEIKIMNIEIVTKMKKNELLPSQLVKQEILIEDKMKSLLSLLEGKSLSEDIIQAIESYKKTQKKINKNKAKYNEMISNFMEACNIKPANFFATFEKIDTDFPEIALISE